jgi:hypothetical protein
MDQLTPLCVEHHNQKTRSEQMGVPFVPKVVHGCDVYGQPFIDFAKPYHPEIPALRPLPQITEGRACHRGVRIHSRGRLTVPGVRQPSSIKIRPLKWIYRPTVKS